MRCPDLSDGYPILQFHPSVRRNFMIFGSVCLGPALAPRGRADPQKKETPMNRIVGLVFGIVALWSSASFATGNIAARRQASKTAVTKSLVADRINPNPSTLTLKGVKAGTVSGTGNTIPGAFPLTFTG